MTSTSLRNGLRVGLITAFVTIFLALIGFTIAASEIIGTFIDTFLRFSYSVGEGVPLSEAFAALYQVPESWWTSPLTHLGIFLALLALWTGASAARRLDDESSGSEFTPRLLSGLIAGVASGLVIAIFAAIIANQAAAEVNLRRYLIALSPEAIEQFTLGRGTVGGPLLVFGVMLIGSIVGAQLRLLLGGLRGPGEAWKAVRGAAASLMNNKAAQYVLPAIVLLIALALPLILPQAWDYNMGTIAIYVLLGLGLNIVVGLAGLLDLGYVAFFAVGAYTVALLTAPEPHGLQWNFWLVIPIAVALAALAGVLLGTPVLRLRGDYLAIVTLGFGEIIRILAGSDALTGFTGGPMGVVGVPLPSILGRRLGSEEIVYVLIIAVLLIIFVTARLKESRVGRAWIAMREDETVAQAMGINTLKYKLLAFGIGAAFAGLGGALFASRNQFTNPQDHTLIVSLNVLAVVIVGGMASIPGVIVGAIALKGIPEILREFQEFRILIFAALLVVMMIVRPEGLWPSQRRRMEMHEEEAESKPPEANVGGEAIV